MKKFYIKGINCKACASYIEKILQEEKEIKAYNFSFINKELEIDCSEEVLKKIERKLNKNNYYLLNNDKEIVKEKNYKKRRLIATLCLFIPLFYLNMGHMLYLYTPDFLNLHHNPLLNLSLQLILVLAISIIEIEYFIKGLKNLFKNPNMDTLIALSSLTSLIFGLYSFIKLTITKDNMYLDNIYFESAGMILTFISIGKYIENIAINKATKELSKIKTENYTTTKILRDKKELEVLKEDITLDDIVIVKSGDEIPTDSIVLNGKGLVDSSSFTGESKLQEKNINDNTLAGTYLKEGYLELKPIALYKNSKYVQILNRIEEMSKTKPRIEKLVDKISFYFVYFVILISILTFILNFFIQKNLTNSINNAITVLVISCPCALGLATPLCVMIASQIAYKKKILIKDIEQLEKASKVNTVLLDKTGTLTNSEFIIEELDGKYKDIIYSLELKSNHPIAKSITNYIKDAKELEVLEVLEYREDIGYGIRGVINGREIKIGNCKYLKEKENKNELYLIIDDEVKSTIKLKSKIKPYAKEVVTELNKKYDTYLVTGDNKEKTKEVANILKIKNVYSEVLPEDKLEIVKNLKAKNKTILMVGDGTNDSLALMKADVSLTIKNATDLAINTSSVVLMKDDLRGILSLLKLSKRTMKTIKINLFFAFFYNLLAIVAATGLLTPINITLNPMIASILMSLSSLFVVFNSTLLYLKQGEKRMYQYKIIVNGMSCNHCKMTVENKFKELDIKANVDLKNKTVELNSLKPLQEDEIKTIITNIGFKYEKQLK